MTTPEPLTVDQLYDMSPSEILAHADDQVGRMALKHLEGTPPPQVTFAKLYEPLAVWTNKGQLHRALDRLELAGTVMAHGAKGTNSRTYWLAAGGDTDR